MSQRAQPRSKCRFVILNFYFSRDEYFRYIRGKGMYPWNLHPFFHDKERFSRGSSRDEESFPNLWRLHSYGGTVVHATTVIFLVAECKTRLKYREKSPRVFSRTIVHNSTCGKKKRNGKEEEKREKEIRAFAEFMWFSCKVGGSGAQRVAGGNQGNKSAPWFHTYMYIRRVTWRLACAASQRGISYHSGEIRALAPLLSRGMVLTFRYARARIYFCNICRRKKSVYSV